MCGVAFSMTAWWVRFSLQRIVTSTIYMNMLEGFAFPQIEDLQPDIIFQQDGAPPHWTVVVRAVLNEKFPGRWIGRDGPTAWPHDHQT